MARHVAIAQSILPVSSTVSLAQHEAQGHGTYRTLRILFWPFEDTESGECVISS